MKWLARSCVPLVVLTCSAILAYSPLLWQLERNLARQPWYWSIWFLPLAALYLAQKRLIGCEVRARADGPATIVITVMAWIVLALAIYLWSSWLAGVSLLVLLLGAACHGWGAAGLRRVAPVWAFLWLALPLPVELDESLITKLRLATTGWASVLLDFVGVVHSTAGNVIEIPGQRLFTAAACSGIHSLQAMLGCGGFYVLWRRRRLFRATLFLAGAILISLASNTVRVASLVWLAAHHYDLTTTFVGHTVSGVVFFAVAMVVAWSWDQSLSWLTQLAYAYSPIPLPWPPQVEQPAQSRRIPNAASPVVTAVPADPAPEPVGGVFDWCGNGRLRAQYLYMGSLAFATLGVLQFTELSAATAARSESHESVAARTLNLAALENTSIDRVFRGWNRMAYEVGSDAAVLPGGRSITWKFYRPGQSLTVCVAYPCPSLHDIRACYEGRGWQVIRSEPAALDELTPACERVSAIQAELRQDSSRHGYLLFAFLTPSGEVAPLDALLDRDLWQRIKDRLARPSRRNRRPDADSLENLVRFQVFLEAWRPISASERQEIQSLLEAAVRELVRETP